MLILGFFFKLVLGGGGGWWRVVPVGGGGGLCLGMVVAGCALYGGVLLKVLSVFFFFFPVTLPLYLFFFLRLGRCHRDQPSPWRSLILTSLCLFFPFGCGFHVIVIMGELVLFQALFFGIVLC